MTEQYEPQRENTTFPKFTIKHETEKGFWITASEPKFTHWVNEVEKRIEALEAKEKTQ